MNLQVIEILTHWHAVPLHDPGVFQDICDKHKLPEDAWPWIQRCLGTTCAVCSYRVDSESALAVFTFLLQCHLGVYPWVPDEKTSAQRISDQFTKVCYEAWELRKVVGQLQAVAYNPTFSKRIRVGFLTGYIEMLKTTRKRRREEHSE